jgi:superfamily I DNA/RNA helicase
MSTATATRVWSPQQDAIFDWFRSGQGHLVVRARAGTGKTTTILQGIHHAPEDAILV